MPIDPDEVTMSHWTRTEGTTPDVSNEISRAIIDVFRTHNPELHVSFSVRYGIAHELQRRLNITKKEE